MSKFILALDQGTTSSRAILFDRNGNIVHLTQQEFTQHFPRPGWVEHDAREIWNTQEGVMTGLIRDAGIAPGDIAAIGITNQRETTILWDRETGEPVGRAIVWQDRRTAGICEELIQAGHEQNIRDKTGLVIDAYFSATKIKWLLDHTPGAREKAAQGRLAFGTVDSWLIWNLTGGQSHITDVTNASRTMLFNIHSLDWDKELLDLFDIPASILPELKSNSEVYALTATGRNYGGIPIAGIAGDQQAALFGQMCTQKGMVKNTYGTGCFMLMNIGEQPVLSNNRLITTVAWRIGDSVQYALEGSIFIGGAVVQWLRDGLGIISRSTEVEALAAQVEDTGGVYLVPAFAGLGAPNWNAHARGMIVGLTRGSSAAHIARAALESIAFQTVDVLRAMEADAGLPIRELRVDGGATANNLLLQIQADLLGCAVVRPRITETTALGAAYLAGLAIGFWKNREEIESQWKEDRHFSPAGHAGAEARIAGWKRAVRACEAWTENL